MPKRRADPDRPPCPPGCTGDEHAYCAAHTRARQDCTQGAVPGGRVCRMHGGRAPQVLAAAKGRLERERAERSVSTYGLPVDIDPGAALLEEVTRTAGHVRWLQSIVADLDPQALVWGDKQEQHQEGRGPEGPIDVKTSVQAAGVSVWLDLYLRERDHLRRVCSDALKAGVRERQVQLAEQAGERAGTWLRATLASLELDDATMRGVMAEGVRHLHLLEAS